MALPKAEVQTIFEKALSQNDAKQLEFAQSISTILEGFPSSWVKNNLVTFLINWIPKNNKIIASAVANHISQLISCDVSLVSLFPLIEILLAFEDQTIKSKVKDSLFKINVKSDSKLLFDSLVGSSYDYVRAFAPSILSLLSSESQILEILKILAADSVVIVRLSVVHSLSKVDESIAKHISTILMRDSSSKIRGGLVHFCSGFSFFSSFVSYFVSDPDWYVRSSVAAQLPKVSDFSVSLPYLQSLIGDKVWQVQIRALRSLTQLIRPGVSHSSLPTILKMLNEILNTPQENLRLATIDAFMAVYSILGFEKYQDVCSKFVAKILQNLPHPIQLHLLTKISETKDKSLFSLVQPIFRILLISLIGSPKWRIRLGTVSIFLSLNSIDPAFDKVGELTKLLLDLVEDKAAVVRSAVVKQLTLFYFSKREKDFPSFYAEMKKSNTFRKRQAALEFLESVCKITTDQSLKQSGIAEIQSFFGDPCRNVVLFAKSLHASLSK